MNVLEVGAVRRNSRSASRLPLGQRRRRRLKSAAALLFLPSLIAFLSTHTQAQVSITVPGNTSPAIQITGLVPMRATINSGNSLNISKVQVLDSSTQLGLYVGNGSTSMDLRGVFDLSAGTHTMTIIETDTNGGTQSASTTFLVASNGNVTQSPVQDVESPSPVAWQATCAANSGKVINAMKVYLDFPTDNVPLDSFSGLSQGSVTESASFNSTQVPPGSHSLTTNCWDNAGQVYQSSVDFTVGSSFPNAPGNAVTLNLDNPTAGWVACPGCSGDAGGDAQETDTYPALPPNYPTIDDGSRNFKITTTDGSGFQGFLWSTSFSNSGSQFANGFPVNWIFDYYVNVSNPLLGHTNVEFDGNQTNGFPSGQGVVLGTQCNYAVSQSGIAWRFWDVSRWNGASGAVPCPLSSYGHWYHVQMYFTLNTSASKYTLQNVRVKDTSTNTVVEDLAPALTFGATLTTAHGNSIDIQLDGNNNQTFPVTYDKINVIRW